MNPGSFADFFTVDLNDVSIAGHSAEDLLPIIVFALNRSAIRDVVVNGRFILRDQKHVLQDEIVSRYQETHHKVWQNSQMGAARENGRSTSLESNSLTEQSP